MTDKNGAVEVISRNEDRYQPGQINELRRPLPIGSFVIMQRQDLNYRYYELLKVTEHGELQHVEQRSSGSLAWCVARLADEEERLQRGEENNLVSQRQRAEQERDDARNERNKAIAERDDIQGLHHESAKTQELQLLKIGELEHKIKQLEGHADIGSLEYDRKQKQERQRDEIKAALAPLIEQARNERKILRTRYADMRLTPDQLEAALAENRFVWGPENWELVDPVGGGEGVE